MDEYVVLRREPVVGYLGTETGGGTPTILTLRVADRREVAGDNSIVALAPSMPMCLVRPVAQEAAQVVERSWGIGAVAADTTSLDGDGACVAVLDTGIDQRHPAFAGVEIEAHDFTGQGLADVDGHGTHCAGTIFGRDVDGIRIGVARGVRRALIGKVIGTEGGTTRQVVDGILWAIAHGAHIISMSIGIDFPGYQRRLVASDFPEEVATSKALEGYRENVLFFERLASFIRAGEYFGRSALLISAAGNESRRDKNPRFSIACGPPAISEGFISVGAIAMDGGQWRAAGFSNVNVTVAAPGVDVVSARLNGGVVAMTGTSMAAPHVAGVAALLVQKHLQSGAFKPQLADAQLKATATQHGMAPGVDSAEVGAGLVQAPKR